MAQRFFPAQMPHPGPTRSARFGAPPAGTTSLALFFDLTEAEAQNGFCDRWPALRERLEKEFTERPTGAHSVMTTGALLVVTATESGDTFTVVSISSNGFRLRCVTVAAFLL